jgi:hypothetical protein
MVHPVIIGSGKRLFPEGAPKVPLRLVDSKVSTTGVLLLTYEPAEQPTGGDEASRPQG